MARPKKQQPPPSDPPAAVDASAEFGFLPIDRVVQSTANPRRTFDDTSMAQLTESIREKGILEPLIVRRMNLRAVPGSISGHQGTVLEMLDDRGNPIAIMDVLYASHDEGQAEIDAGLFEIVAGERRYRAARAAELTQVPCRILKLTDRQAAEVAVIENDQREDVPPIEQAWGYGRLVKLGESVEEISLKIGRPVRYVTDRLRLTGLIEPLRAALASGRLPIGHALLLSRLTEADQRFVHKSKLYRFPAQNATTPGDDRGGVRTLRELARTIRYDLCPDLADAPWALDDDTLWPPAGPCVGCSKRVATDATLFAGIEDETPEDAGTSQFAQSWAKDPCMDRACYETKRKLWIEIGLERVRRETGAAEVLRVSEECHDRYGLTDKKSLPTNQYEKLSESKAKKDPEARPAIVTDGEDAGKTIWVKPKAAASPAAANGTGSTYDWERQRKITEITRRTVAEALWLAITGGSVDADDVWPKVADMLIDTCYVTKDILQAAIEAKSWKALAAKSWESQVAVLAILTIHGDLHGSPSKKHPTNLLLESCGIDVKAVRKKADKDLAEAEKADSPVVPSAKTGRKRAKAKAGVA